MVVGEKWLNWAGKKKYDFIEKKLLGWSVNHHLLPLRRERLGEPSRNSNAKGQRREMRWGLGNGARLPQGDGWAAQARGPGSRGRRPSAERHTVP